jgi:amino acid permease
VRTTFEKPTTLPTHPPGSWLTAAGHLVTAIIGAGVLGLPNAVAWLGWVAGPACLVLFFATTLWTATMLCDCYHVKGKRHTRYKWAVLHIMGPRHAVVLALCQNLNMVGGGAGGGGGAPGGGARACK